MKNQKTLLILAITLSGSLFVLIMVVIAGVFYYKAQMEKGYLENSGTSSGETTHVPSVDEINPYQVTTYYFQNMMGSIPGGIYKPEIAKSYTTAQLASKLDDLSFAPTSFCIQDGPDDIRVDTGKINKKDATVKVSGKYGGTWQQLWEISLVKQKDGWKVSEIECLGASGPTGDTNDQDPYAGQKVEDVPVYMGSTVKSFYKDASSQNAGYTASKGTTSAQILKYYETNMPVWGWTLISSDSDRSRTFKHSDGRRAEVWIYYSNPSEGVEYVIDCPPLNSSLPAQ